jgi:hypothetical protein
LHGYIAELSLQRIRPAKKIDAGQEKIATRLQSQNRSATPPPTAKSSANAINEAVNAVERFMPMRALYLIRSSAANSCNRPSSSEVIVSAMRFRFSARRR